MSCAPFTLFLLNSLHAFPLPYFFILISPSFTNWPEVEIKCRNRKNVGVRESVSRNENRAHSSAPLRVLLGRGSDASLWLEPCHPARPRQWQEGADHTEPADPPWPDAGRNRRSAHPIGQRRSQFSGIGGISREQQKVMQESCLKGRWFCSRQLTL